MFETEISNSLCSNDNGHGQTSTSEITRTMKRAIDRQEIKRAGVEGNG